MKPNEKHIRSADIDVINITASAVFSRPNLSDNNGIISRPNVFVTPVSITMIVPNSPTPCVTA
jgi:hypothetical protein